MAMELDIPSRSSDASGSPSRPPPGGNSTSSSIFDLESYISRYDPQSETRLQRLLLIGSKSTSEETVRAAYVLAEQQMRDTANLRRYREVFGGTSASVAAAGGGDAAAAGSGSGGKLASIACIVWVCIASSALALCCPLCLALPSSSFFGYPRLPSSCIHLLTFIYIYVCVCHRGCLLRPLRSPIGDCARINVLRNRRFR